MQKLIAELEKNSIEKVRAELNEYNDRQLFSLRVWAEKDDSKDLIPTKKGITISIEMLPDITKALVEAEAQARAAGLIH